MELIEYLDESREVLDTFRDNPPIAEVNRAIDLLTEALTSSRPVLVCGNGGSASDALHIAAELVGRFRRERRAGNCICLSSNPAVITAWANDYEYDSVFARQVEAHGASGGVLLGLSTSGSSGNVVQAFEAARASGMSTIGITGQGGGLLAPISDVLLTVPSTVTQYIQQVHICLYHYICQEVEERLAR